METGKKIVWAGVIGLLAWGGYQLYKASNAPAKKLNGVRKKRKKK